MKKLLPFIVFTLLLSACTPKTPTPEDQADQNEQSQTGEEDDSFVGSLFDAVKLGTGMKCTYTVDGNNYEGYVKGKQYRGKITSQGQISEVIMKDDCMWTWSASSPQGMKMCYSPEEANSTLWGEDQSENQDNSEEVSYTAPNIQYECHAEVISDNEFNPPSDIQFMDLGSMMQMGQ